MHDPASPRARRARPLFLASSSSLAALAVALAGACGQGTTHAPDHDAGAYDAGVEDAGADAPPLDPPSCQFETPPKHPTGGVIPSAPIRVGLGSAVLPMPIGAPLGGYGDRCIPLGNSHAADARPLRYAKAFVPSIGVADAPQAEAIAIEAGQDRVVIVRIDSVLLNENNLFALEQAIAPDGSMRGRVIASASHSHSAWAGWQASKILMPGIDLPRKELADRMVSAMAQAAKQALASLAPARIGFAVNPDFDPMDTVTHDRRQENDDVLGPDGNTAGKGKDPIVWAMRVDDMNGNPVAAVVDLPIHGIVGDENNPLLTADAPGAIERALSASLGFPVLHLQGAAGDINPSVDAGRVACPDVTRCLDLPRLEVIGARAAALVAPLVQGITTSGEAAMEVVTHTFPVRRSQPVKRPDGMELVYAPFDPTRQADGILLTDAGWCASPIDEFNTVAGAGLCGNPQGGTLDHIPGAQGIGPYTSCLDLVHGRDIVFGLFDVVDKTPLPLCDSIRATAAAVRLSGLASGDWLLVTAPGEPVAPFAAYLRNRSPAGKDHTLLVGYSDDHAGYLLTAEDWLAGGYEPSINIWGPLEGEMIIDGILGAAKVAWTQEREDPEVGSSRFLDWTFPDVPMVAQLTTTDHGQPAAVTPDSWWPDTSAPVTLGGVVPRVTGAARFVWHGGDPAVDLPEVIVEQQAPSGAFTPLLDARGQPASSRRGAAVIAYVPEPLAAAAPTSHQYTVTWQPVPPDPYTLSAPSAPYALPLGTYRFHVTGNALTASGTVPYDLTSPPFTVVAAPLDPSSTAAVSGSSIAVQALLGSAPGLRALRDSASDSGVPLPGPWTVTVSFSGLPQQVVTVTPDAMGNGTVPLTAAQAAQAASVDVRDAAGNGGVIMLP
jgi:neutral ceramidase